MASRYSDRNVEWAVKYIKPVVKGEVWGKDNIFGKLSVGRMTKLPRERIPDEGKKSKNYTVLWCSIRGWTKEKTRKGN